MGQDISELHRLDETTYTQRLRDETRQVMAWFRDRQFERRSPPGVGLELEAWLVDDDQLPAPRNEDFLRAVGDPLCVPELSQFNFEFNTHPDELEGRIFSRYEGHLRDLWAKGRVATDSLGLNTVMVGMPATLREDMLTPQYMTPSSRYELLNDRVLAMRNGSPLHVAIDGRDELDLVQDHLMLEAACTSFQIHLMLDPDRAARTYNAAQIASAPLIAAAANSPFLYGRRLWEETRIPAFEAAINLPSYRAASGRRVGRVTFGSQHVRDSLMELFLENLDGYPALLPMVLDESDDPLVHFKLHNGTIWRWNRPIVDLAKDGTPHLRVENRVLPAGPSLCDMIANMAFFIGLTLHLEKEANLEERLPFEITRSNFYRSARRGLGATITWLDGDVTDVQMLIHNQLAGLAEQALIDAGTDANEARHYMGIIRARALNGQNGAAWHRAHANRHGRDFQKLMRDYHRHQQGGRPVHTWTV